MFCTQSVKHGSKCHRSMSTLPREHSCVLVPLRVTVPMECREQTLWKWVTDSWSPLVFGHCMDSWCERFSVRFTEVLCGFFSRVSYCKRDTPTLPSLMGRLYFFLIKQLDTHVLEYFFFFFSFKSMFKQILTWQRISVFENMYNYYNITEGSCDWCVRVRKLKETLVMVQQLDKNMSNLRTWLSRIEGDLTKPIVFSVCHSDEIQCKLNEQQV